MRMWPEPKPNLSQSSHGNMRLGRDNEMRDWYPAFCRNTPIRFAIFEIPR